MLSTLAAGAVVAAGASLSNVVLDRSGSTLAGGTSTAAGLVLPASADTYVIEERPAAAPGSAAKITAAAWAGWHTESYLSFTVPAGVKFEGARVELTFERLTNQPATVELRRLAATGWSERTSWDDKPVPGEVLTSAEILEQGAATVSFDVSAWVTEPGTYAFAITNPGRQSAARFHSREQGAPGPRLVLVKPQGGESPAPRPTAVTPTAGAPETPVPNPEPTHAPPPRPAPAPIPAGRTMCGASFVPENSESHVAALRRVDSMYGDLKIIRVFYPGLPAAWPGRMGSDPRPQVVSFKMNPREILAGRHDAFMRSWFAKAPRGRDIYWSYYHEPEDNIRGGEFTAADYRAAWKRLRGLADAAGNNRLRATLILMGWSVEPASGRNWKDYYAGKDTIQVLGWDVYNMTEAKGIYQDPKQMFGRVVAASKAEDLPWGVAEFGSYLLGGDTGAKRDAWLRASAKHMVDNDALWAAYFDLDWPSGDFRLRDAPSIQAWRDFC